MGLEPGDRLCLPLTRARRVPWVFLASTAECRECSLVTGFVPLKHEKDHEPEEGQEGTDGSEGMSLTPPSITRAWACQPTQVRSALEPLAGAEPLTASRWVCAEAGSVPPPFASSTPRKIRPRFLKSHVLLRMTLSDPRPVGRGVSSLCQLH